jgi:hypothetical protein
MTVTIDIHYTASSSRALQSGSFPLRGKKPEMVAYDFWRQIKKVMSYRAELEKVIINGNNDITELVKGLEKQEWRKIEDNWNLPF